MRAPCGESAEVDSTAADLAIKAACKEEVVSRALQFFSQAKNWVNLYKVLDAISDDLGSLDAVKMARAQLKPGDLQRKVKIEGKEVTVDGMYLRIIVHDNEHMGQLIAYARMMGVVPPWSEPAHK